MSHLTPDEFVDAAERTLASDRRAHLSSCEQCRVQASQLASLMSAVRDVDVPEPSPLFWNRLSDRVRVAIAAEPQRPPGLRRWFQWPVLVPVAAMAAMVFAVGLALPREAVDTTQAVADVDLVDPIGAAVEADAHWELLEALVSDADLDAAEQSGIAPAPGAADGAVLALTVAEQQELVRLLREELSGSGG